MLINQSAVKKYVNSSGKRLEKAALVALEKSVSETLNAALRATRHFKTVRAEEISLSLVKKEPLDLATAMEVRAMDE